MHPRDKSHLVMVNDPFNVLLRIWANGESHLSLLGLSSCMPQAQLESTPHKPRPWFSRTCGQAHLISSLNPKGGMEMGPAGAQQRELGKLFPPLPRRQMAGQPLWPGCGEDSTTRDRPAQEGAWSPGVARETNTGFLGHKYTRERGVRMCGL